MHGSGHNLKCATDPGLNEGTMSHHQTVRFHHFLSIPKLQIDFLLLNCVQRLLEGVAMARSMRITLMMLSILRIAILGIRSMLIRPREDRFEVAALMRRPHTIDSLLVKGFECDISGTLKRLADIVQAMVAMVDNLFRCHIFHILRIVGKSQKVQTMELVEHGNAVYFVRFRVLGSRL